MKIAEMSFKVPMNLPGGGQRGTMRSGAKSDHFDITVDYGKRCVRICLKANPKVRARIIPFEAVAWMDEAEETAQPEKAAKKPTVTA